MIFISKPSVYNLPGTWEKQPMIQHLNLTPEKDSTITVLEDVITTGGSAIKAVKRLRDAGYKVNRIVSIVDRQENDEADTAMKLAGLELRSLFKEKDFVE